MVEPFGHGKAFFVERRISLGGFMKTEEYWKGFEDAVEHILSLKERGLTKILRYLLGLVKERKFEQLRKELAVIEGGT